MRKIKLLAWLLCLIFVCGLILLPAVRGHLEHFISDHRGDLVAELDRDEEGVVTAGFDLDFLDRHRAAWGFFRDRRPELYSQLAAPRSDS